jgi:hypothetical protein
MLAAAEAYHLEVQRSSGQDVPEEVRQLLPRLRDCESPGSGHELVAGAPSRVVRPRAHFRVLTAMTLAFMTLDDVDADGRSEFTG